MLTPGGGVALPLALASGSVQQQVTTASATSALPNMVHTQFNPPHVLVPANPYLHEEIPIWLRVYFKASPTLDHHLKWDLFRLQELECFDAMQTRLFRDELEELVLRYEAIRMAFTQELERRNVAMNVQLQPVGGGGGYTTVSGFNNPTSGYNQNNTSFNQNNTGFNQNNTGFNQNTSGFNNTTSGFNSTSGFKNNAVAVQLVAAAVAEQQLQQHQQNFPGNAAQTPLPGTRNPPGYYQGATISEIDDTVGSSEPAIIQGYQTPQPIYPGNYYQGATISEIDDTVGSSETMTYQSYQTTGSVQHGPPHPQAVQASPVLVLQGVHTGHPHDIQASSTSHLNQHNRHKL